MHLFFLGFFGLLISIRTAFYSSNVKSLVARRMMTSTGYWMPLSKVLPLLDLILDESNILKFFLSEALKPSQSKSGSFCSSRNWHMEAYWSGLVLDSYWAVSRWLDSFQIRHPKGGTQSKHVTSAWMQQQTSYIPGSQEHGEHELLLRTPGSLCNLITGFRPQSQTMQSFTTLQSTIEKPNGAKEVALQRGEVKEPSEKDQNNLKTRDFNIAILCLSVTCLLLADHVSNIVVPLYNSSTEQDQFWSLNKLYILAKFYLDCCVLVVFYTITSKDGYLSWCLNLPLQIILQERPRVVSSAVGYAWDLPANTFGAAYAKFMGSRNFSPDDRPPVRFMETEELAYVATRAREIHDFWHVLFNLPTNMLGESALKVIEFQQMFLPMCFLSVVGGSIRLKGKQHEIFFKHYFPWAIKAGMSCTDIMSLYYEKHFSEDLEVVRKKWGILPAPDLKSLRASLKS
eukprot:Gb_19887 [translate_table: standard]